MIHQNHRSQLPLFVAYAAILVGLASRAGGQVIPIDDFEDGNADGWVHTEWPYHDPDIPIVMDATTGVYRLGTSVPVPEWWEEAVISAWTPSYGPDAPLYSQGFLRARVRAMNNGTDVALAMRAADPSCAGLTYVFFARPTGEIGILVVPDCLGFGYWLEDGDTLNPLQIGFQPNGQWWWLEAGAVGNELSLRAWREGDDPPSAPQLVIQDPDRTFAIGGFTVGVVHQYLYPTFPLAGQFDDLTFRPACPGDFDLDGEVGLSDLSVLLAHFGSVTDAHYRVGDLDGDGDVDLQDLTSLLALFGTSCAGPAP